METTLSSVSLPGLKTGAAGAIDVSWTGVPAPIEALEVGGVAGAAVDPHLLDDHATLLEGVGEGARNVDRAAADDQRPAPVEGDRGSTPVDGVHNRLVR